MARKTGSSGGGVRLPKTVAVRGGSTKAGSGGRSAPLAQSGGGSKVKGSPVKGQTRTVAGLSGSGGSASGGKKIQG